MRLSLRLLAAARRRRVAPNSSRSAGYQGLPDVPMLFKECDQDGDGRLWGSEALRLSQWLGACAPEPVVNDFFAATGSPDDLVLQDVEHIHAGIQKHTHGNQVDLDPHHRVIVMHGTRPGTRAIDAENPGAFITALYGHMAHDAGGMLYDFVADCRAYIDSATYWRAHFSVGRIQHVDASIVSVGYGSGTFNERDIERVDILHHAKELMQAEFGVSSPYLLPYPSEQPRAIGIYPDAWMEVADQIPWTGLIRYVGGVPVRVTRSMFVSAREQLPQEYFICFPGFMPSLRVYEMAPNESIEIALRALWPGESSDLVMEFKASGGGWNRPSAGSRFRDLLPSRMRVCVAGNVLELNGGAVIQKYQPGFLARSFAMLKSF